MMPLGHSNGAARRVRTIAPRLFALAAVLAAAPAWGQDAALTDPVTLFNTVCLGDKVSLSAKDFETTPFAGLPAGAKIALSFSLPPGGVPNLQPRALPAPEMPNRLLAVLPKKDVFLILPAPGAPGSYAAFCAVAWRGDHYADALKVAQGLVPADSPVPLGTGIRGLNYAAFRGKGAIVGAAEYQQWTVLRIAPDETPTETHPAQ